MKRRTENGELRTENGERRTFHFSFSVFRFPLSVLLIAFLFASCSTRKKLVTPATHADYQWMTAKMNGELITENGDISFTGSVRMRRDSVVWLSASALLGMENVRTLVTQDSVFLLNRLEQTYLAEPLPDITLREIQSKLAGSGTADHVEIQYGSYTAKIKYSEVHWDEPTTFPFKINKNYERIRP